MRYRLRSAALAGALAAALSMTAGAGLAVEVGQRAPKFAVQKLDGNGSLSLTDYRGKVVYLDFWASWCAPCLVALPEIERLRKELPAAQFQVIAVNLDRDLDKAREFLRRHKIGYPSGSDPNGSVAEVFDLDTMPSSFVIDRNGIVRYIHRGFRERDVEEIRKQVRRALQER